MSKPHPTERSRNDSRARLLLPALLLGVGVALSSLLLARQEPVQSVSDVRRAIHELALRRNEGTGREPGGSIGPWHVAAEAADRATGEFVNLRITSDDMYLSAERAVLLIDPEDDTISFQLRNLVYASAAPGVDDDRSEDPHFLHQLDRYLLGPAPYGTEIVPDGDPKGRSRPLELPDSVAEAGD